MKREIPGIDAIARAYPEQWLLYASLNCYPRAQSPMEIDALVVLDDRVLLLELKDWNGKLTQRGDLWFVNGQYRGRSAVIQAEEKAKKLKAVLTSEIPQLRQLWVDYRVVLTATSTRDNIPEQFRKYIWTLAEACQIASPQHRATLLSQQKLGLLKAFQFEDDFDRVTNNTKIFQPLEADWGGYQVTEENVVVHPRQVWREHRVERRGEARLKALLRVWSFDRLPAGLNSPDKRRQIVEREIKAFAHLAANGSALVDRNALLREIGGRHQEVVTNHFELRALQQDWMTWDRYLESHRDQLELSDRVILVSNLLTCAAELHRFDVVHRDIGPRAVWVGSPSRIALNGFMCCQLPEEETVADWLTTLRGYAPAIPEDDPTELKATGHQRDVYLLALLASQAIETQLEQMPPSQAQDMRAWLAKAMDREPTKRHGSAIELASSFAVITESVETNIIDQTLLDRHEVSSIPYVKWPPSEFLIQDVNRSVYTAEDSSWGRVVVKVWNGVRRNTNTATDISLSRLLESASRVISAPVAGLPRYFEAGLSPIGPYLVYGHANGISLDKLPQLLPLDALEIAANILGAISQLHELGCDHGDLAPKNIIYDTDAKTVCVLDAFDFSPVGSGAARTLTFCPSNWEQLSQQCIDRYAALTVVIGLLQSCREPSLDETITRVSQERDRPVVETLTVAETAISDAIHKLSKPRPLTFALHYPEATDNYFMPDGDGYFLTRRSAGRDSFLYTLTGPRRELVMTVENGQLAHARFQRTGFGSLAYASRNGARVVIDISVSRGQLGGFAHLLQHLEGMSVETIVEPEVTQVESPRVSMDIPRHWDRMLDLETRDRLEVEILEEQAHTSGQTIYTFKSLGRLLDFDPDSLIDVYLPPNRRVGELEQGFTSTTNSLAIRNANRRLRPGDTVYLVDRREQTSIDRRTKAVRRILDGQAAITHLIEYFTPQSTVKQSDFGITVPDAVLDAYGLNAGQKDAFRHILRYGPVGLLQGPPGTGKTHFIASLVHWLMTAGGAKRVLVASQSHEAVNNAIEALVDLYKSRGERPNLLRIGSKGITEKIRPYHSAELRERYRIRFEAALKYRVSILAMEKGVSRKLVSDVLEVDDTLGNVARLCLRLRQLAQETSAPSALERARYLAELDRAERKLDAVARKVLAQPANLAKPAEIVDLAFAAALERNIGSSPADLNVVRLSIDLARDWLNSMSSLHRNFDEFLAKTRGVITATCVGVGETKIRIDASQFDWVIVDEAARCTSSELAVPIHMGRRLLLVGDHLQLLPMLKRNLIDAMQEEFPSVPREEIVRSDFERAFVSTYGSTSGKRLTEQYRMHPAICDLVSKCFYEQHRVTLVTSPNRKPAFDAPSDLPAWLAKPICWLDTSDTDGFRETQPANSTSYLNRAEVEAVVKALGAIAANTELVNSLSKLSDDTPIGVISMYSAQKNALEVAIARHPWAPRFRRLIRVDTVDAYQGKENAIVIVSLVRANPMLQQGHVRVPNRCNVAISRAKERVVIVGARTMWRSVPVGSPMRIVLEYLERTDKTVSILSPALL